MNGEKENSYHFNMVICWLLALVTGVFAFRGEPDYVNESYRNAGFHLSNLGLAHVHLDRSALLADDELKKLGLGPNAAGLFDSMTIDFLKQNTRFLGVRVLDIPFTMREAEFKSERGNTQTFMVPADPEQLARDHGLGYILIVQDLTLSGLWTEREPNATLLRQTPRYKETLTSITPVEPIAKTYQYEMVCKFRYILLDLLNRRVVQYGSASNYDESVKLDHKDWSDCITRALSRLTKRAAFEYKR